MFTTPAVWTRKLNINISDAAHMSEGSHTPNARFLKNLRLKFNGFQQPFLHAKKLELRTVFWGPLVHACQFQKNGLFPLRW